jgi:uncharacterized glyoxalase superfamily protein PhnB
MPPRLDAVGIVARDLGTSVGFYRALGLDFPDPGDDDHLEAAGPGGLRVMIDSEESVLEFDPNWSRPTGTNVALAFLCGSPQEVDSLYARLVESGAAGRREPWDAFWGQRYAQLYDPDGNAVDLFAPL